jgi:hypothetical protein
VNHKQYLAKIGAKGGKAKSAAKTEILAGRNPKEKDSCPK